MTDKRRRSLYALARAFHKPWISRPTDEDVVDELCDQFRHILCAGENLVRQPGNGEYIARMRMSLDEGWEMFKFMDEYVMEDESGDAS